MNELEKVKTIEALKIADGIICDAKLQLEGDAEQMFENDFYTISTLIIALEVRIKNAK